MFIGFAERCTIVRENTSAPNTEFHTNITLHSLRKSEIEYHLRINVTGGNATVTHALTPTGAWDASLGNETSNVLITLSRGETEVQLMQVSFINDINSEATETFGLRMSIQDDGGQTVKCYDVGENPVQEKFFCSHTVIILDDDGQFQIVCSVQYFSCVHI